MEKNDFIKMDSYMALSIINMKLRDEFSTLEDYCSYMDLELDKVNEKFSQIGYKYDEKSNQFVAI
ncbi:MULTISPECIES: DUF4250 domain-containing protein [Clostridium]|uniref:DUF4250 domain-containing protein n=1 Tax=Clostridium cadaveris TaxID=1529 RepID=A0A1I2J1Z3_9CLOT|nr:DUF4250 domain-containing protein [Clostridium cadaveris]MDU4951541.1 DUF4250 domain-containing protein [Clostridium sp.]MDM8311360.1 DUF4250 domain-containing protein [Clostridium cadaveris]MDY4950512.1 DUF4250 domain-containing protein [Clostridium cadaveris]NME63268.1 DUF4250 domain-containing protein [Clostridium cadaveris]NWK10194.1 DUF4250 domain-containing protein [Clostridium cadaveris]